MFEQEDAIVLSIGYPDVSCGIEPNAGGTIERASGKPAVINRTRCEGGRCGMAELMLALTFFTGAGYLITRLFCVSATQR